MKAIYKIYLLGITLGLIAFTACEEAPVREVSPEDTATGSQAYFTENNKKSLAFLPNDTTIFSVEIGRRNTDAVDTIAIQITDEKGVFVLADSVYFSAGESLQLLEVDFSAMPLGMNTELGLKLDPKDATIYGTSELVISVLRDYKWIDRGSVTVFEYGFALGEGGPVPIQQAEKEEIFRLVDPMSPFSEEDDGSDTEGYYFVFSLDTTEVGNFAMKGVNQGVQRFASSQFSSYAFYFNSVNYAPYCYFDTYVNLYSISLLYANLATNGLAGPITYEFIWDVDFPGVIPDPYEDDATINVNWVATAADVSYWGYLDYSYPIQDKFGGDDWYIVDEFEITLEAANGEVVLSLLTDYVGGAVLPTGEFPINTSDKENTVRAGFKAGFPNGSFVSVPSIGANLYLVDGTVTIEEENGEYTIAVAAESALGSQVEASWTGTVTIVDETAVDDDDEPSGVKSQMKVQKLRPGQKLPLNRK